MPGNQGEGCSPRLTVKQPSQRPALRSQMWASTRKPKWSAQPKPLAWLQQFCLQAYKSQRGILCWFNAPYREQRVLPKRLSKPKPTWSSRKLTGLCGSIRKPSAFKRAKFQEPDNKQWAHKRGSINARCSVKSKSSPRNGDSKPFGKLHLRCGIFRKAGPKLFTAKFEFWKESSGHEKQNDDANSRKQLNWETWVLLAWPQLPGVLGVASTNKNSKQVARPPILNY